GATAGAVGVRERLPRRGGAGRGHRGRGGAGRAGRADDRGAHAFPPRSRRGPGRPVGRRRDEPHPLSARGEDARHGSRRPRRGAGALRWVIVGCGYVGERLSRALAAAGADVLATTRSPARAAALPVAAAVADPYQPETIPFSAGDIV